MTPTKNSLITRRLGRTPRIHALAACVPHTTRVFVDIAPRAFLAEHGFELTSDTTIKERNRLYTILVAERTPGANCARPYLRAASGATTAGNAASFACHSAASTSCPPAGSFPCHAV